MATLKEMLASGEATAETQPAARPSLRDMVASGVASAAAVPSRAADVATTRQGTWAVYGGTYSKATGGATAANDITLYENGAVVASTATNAGAYVAMEDGASVPTLGALNGGASAWMPGRLAFVLVAQKNMSAADHAAITQLLRSYAGL